MDTPDSTQPPDDPRWSTGRIVGLVVGGLAAVGLVVLLIVGLVSQGDDLTIDRDIAEGNAVQAPAVELPVLFAADGVEPEGASFALERLRGNTVVVNLWASWCAPCREEAPILQRISNRYRDKGVVVLGINTQDTPGDAKAFLKEFELTFPSLRDGTDGTSKKFQTTGLPETIIIEPDGMIRFLPYRGGIGPAQEREINEYLDRLVAQ